MLYRTNVMFWHIAPGATHTCCFSALRRTNVTFWYVTWWLVRRWATAEDNMLALYWTQLGATSGHAGATKDLAARRLMCTGTCRAEADAKVRAFEADHRKECGL